MNNRGSSYFLWFLILLSLTVGLSVQNSSNFNIQEFKDSLNWTPINLNVNSSPDLGNALESLINGLGETMFHLGKWVAQLSYENPNVPFKLLIYLVFFAIFTPILIFILRASIIIFLLIKEFFQNRKEKREFNLLNIKLDRILEHGIKD